MKIIPYQEIIGNYSYDFFTVKTEDIIPYQEIIGNYSMHNAVATLVGLYHTKK